MDRASRTLRGIFNNGASPSFCVWAHGGIGASEIVQQVIDGYAFDRVQTQRLLGSSLGDDVRPDRGRDGGGTAFGSFGSFILPRHPPPSSNSSLPHGTYSPPIPEQPDVHRSAEFQTQVDAAVQQALRALGISSLTPFDEPPPSPPRGFNLKGLTLEVAVRECLAENFMTQPVWYGCPPPPGRVESRPNAAGTKDCKRVAETPSVVVTGADCAVR